MEVDLDVGSSSVAATVVGLVQGATKSLVVDMGIVLEGHTPEELPESLLGTVRRCCRSCSAQYGGKRSCLHAGARDEFLCGMRQPL